MSNNQKIISILNDGTHQENLRKCTRLIEEQHDLIKMNSEQYWGETKDLIFSNNIIKQHVGICVARHYLGKKGVSQRLQSIIENDSLQGEFGLQMRIQAIHEHLEEKSTPPESKENWLEFILSHLPEYKKIVLDNIFGEIQNDEEKFEKISERYRKCVYKNKLWVYLIQLSICGLMPVEAKEIIKSHTHDDDSFVKKVANLCLESLLTKA